MPRARARKRTSGATKPATALVQLARVGKAGRDVANGTTASPGGTKSRYTVQSLAIGLQVLEDLVRAGGLVGVTELSENLGVSK